MFINKYLYFLLKISAVLREKPADPPVGKHRSMAFRIPIFYFFKTEFFYLIYNNVNLGTKIY